MNNRKIRKLLSSPREFFIDAIKNKLSHGNNSQGKHIQIHQESKTSIMTFGSCFSRRIADQYVKIFGGKVISSVYHNRSDYFCQQFIDGDSSNPELDTLINSIEKPSNFIVTNRDNDPFLLLRNQHANYIGLHGLKNGTNFLHALETKKANIIVIDNFMDIVARLYQHDNKKLFFLPQQRINELNASSCINKNWSLGELLNLQEGAECLSRIVTHVHIKQPNAKIFYVNFPSTTYAQTLEKKKRFEYYQYDFKNSNCHSIAPINILRPCQTEDKRHFTTPLYAAYAGIINSTLF